MQQSTPHIAPSTSPPQVNPPEALDEKRLKEIAELVYKRNAELVQLDKMKDEFVAIVSHELRTPLTIVKNYLWLVLNKDTAQVGAEPLRKIQIAIQSVERLMALVEDTLMVSRIENAKIILKKEKMDIVGRIKYIVEIYSLQAHEKDILINIKSPFEEFLIEADINRIHEVFVNLLGNAIKFSPKKGEIQFVITVSEDKKNVLIAVKDQGPGVPKEKQDILFTKFGKIDESYVNLPNVNGTGLGLYISQEIVKMHGGLITVESEYGEGATFTVSLPIYPV